MAFLLEHKIFFEMYKLFLHPFFIDIIALTSADILFFV